MLDVEGDRFAQAGDLFVERAHGPAQQRVERRVVEVLLPVAQPTVARDRVLHIEAIGLRRVGHGPETDLQHEEGMLDQERAQFGDVLLPLAEFDQQRLDVGGRRVRHGTGPRARRPWCRDRVPVQMGEEGAVAPHDGIMIPQGVQHALVKRAAVGYHGNRLLGRMGEWYLPLCHGAVSAAKSLYYVKVEPLEIGGKRGPRATGRVDRAEKG